VKVRSPSTCTLPRPAGGVQDARAAASFPGGAAGEAGGDDGERGVARESVRENPEREGLAVEDERTAAVGGDAEGGADETGGRDRGRRFVAEGHRDGAVGVGGEIRPRKQGRGQHGLPPGRGRRRARPSPGRCRRANRRLRDGR
jgi:hypothetical protein